MIRAPDWQRGNCRLYLDDCRNLLPTIEAEAVDFAFFDPPYGHNNNDDDDLIARREAALGRGTNGEARPIATDGDDANDLIRYLFVEMRRVLAPGCCCCCCCGGGGGPDPQFARWSLWLDEAMDFKQMIVWDKGPMGMGWHYRRSYETVLVGQIPGAACRWFCESSDVENIVRPGDYGIRKIIPQADEHPTEKPWELAAHFIRLHTQPGELVIDPTCGAGSTGVACVHEGRQFIGCELDRQWFDLAVRRIDAAYDAFSLLDPTPPATIRQGELFEATP